MFSAFSVEDENNANEKKNLVDLKAEIQRRHKEMMKPKSEKLEAKNSDLEKITKEVDKRKGVDDAKVFEQNDEETTEVSEPNPTLIDAPAVVDQDKKEVDSEPAAVAEVPIEIDEPVAVVEEETVEASATEIEVEKEDPNLLVETSYACIIA